MTSNTPADADLAAEYERLPFYRRAWFCGAVLVGSFILGRVMGDAATLLGGLAALGILWRYTSHAKVWGATGKVNRVTPRQRWIATAVCALLVVGSLMELAAGPDDEGLPTCDSGTAREMVAGAIAKSPSGVTVGLRLVSLHNIKDNTAPTAASTLPLMSRSCYAAASTTAGPSFLTYTIKQDPTDGSIEVTTLLH